MLKLKALSKIMRLKIATECHYEFLVPYSRWTAKSNWMEEVTLPSPFLLNRQPIQANAPRSCTPAQSEPVCCQALMWLYHLVWSWFLVNSLGSLVGSSCMASPVAHECFLEKRPVGLCRKMWKGYANLISSILRQCHYACHTHCAYTASS